MIAVHHTTPSKPDHDLALLMHRLKDVRTHTNLGTQIKTKRTNCTLIITEVNSQSAFSFSCKGPETGRDLHYDSLKPRAAQRSNI